MTIGLIISDVNSENDRLVFTTLHGSTVLKKTKNK